jgi:hypothetical protein
LDEHVRGSRNPNALGGKEHGTRRLWAFFLLGGRWRRRFCLLFLAERELRPGSAQELIRCHGDDESRRTIRRSRDGDVPGHALVREFVRNVDAHRIPIESLEHDGSNGFPGSIRDPTHCDLLW